MTFTNDKTAPTYFPLAMYGHQKLLEAQTDGVGGSAGKKYQSSHWKCHLINLRYAARTQGKSKRVHLFNSVSLHSDAVWSTALLILNHGTRRTWEVSFTLRPLYSTWQPPVGLTDGL
jgi:hypothetical protein